MKMAASVVEPCASHQRHRGLKTAGSSRKALALPSYRWRLSRSKSWER